MTVFEIIWLAFAIAFTAVELFALLIRTPRDTFSGALWRLSHKSWFRVCLFALDGWLLWHLLVQPYLPWNTTHIIWIDWVIVAAFGLIGFSVGTPKWRQQSS